MKNINKSNIRRPWKTSSPNHHQSFKSLRVGRNLGPRNSNHLKISKQNEAKQQSARFQTAIKHFRSELLTFREESSKTVGSEEKKNSTQLSLKNHRHFNKTQVNENKQVTPYSVYFNYNNKDESNQKIEQNQNPKLKESSNYRQTLRKCAAQNIKLKKQLKEFQHRQSELKQQIHSLQIKIHKLTASSKQNQFSHQISQLKKQIHHYKELITTSNAQLYKTRQDLCQVQVNKNKLQSKLQVFKKLKCTQCEKIKEQLATVTNQLQIKMQELGEKDQTFNDLCQEMKKTQLEMRMFEKPKQMHKKFTQIINDLNEEVLRVRMQALNRKYKQN